MYVALNIMAGNYSNGITLTGEVINPFVGNLTNFTLSCDYCDSIYDTIIEVNDTISNQAKTSLSDLSETLNSTQLLIDANDAINDGTSQLQDSIDEILQISNDTQVQYNDYMSDAADYDSERETYITLFFCLLFIFLLIPIFGVLLKSKWCFKINWCLGMYCSSLLLLLSIPFVFVTTLCADFCVRLDEFEYALPTTDSQLAEAIFNISGINDAKVTIDEANEITAQDVLRLIDVCFDGGSLLQVFNLSNVLDWTQYRQQLDDILNIDLSTYLQIDELETFQTEIDTLSTEEYSNNVDEYIAKANSIPNCYCVNPNNPFNRKNLNPGTQCTWIGFVPSINATIYWGSMNVSNIECAQAFENASYAVQIENSSLQEAQIKIDTLKKESRNIFAAYDVIYSTTYQLIVKIQNITCLVYPLFDEFDQLLQQFTNCGFLGKRYGDFKEVGCVTLFNDFNRIGRALVIIAFMCILIVLFSLCLDQVYAPWLPKQDHFGNEQDAKPYYIDDIDNNNNNDNIELHGPITPITPNNMTQGGFGRVASASPVASPVDVDGDFGTIPYSDDNDNDNDNDNGEIDEMDGAITRNVNDEMNDEYPVLPVDQDENQENIQQIDGENYTVPQINDNYAD